MLSGGVYSPVKVYRSYNGLKRVGKYGVPLPSARCFLALSKHNIVAYVYLSRPFGKAGLAYSPCPQLCQLSLGHFGIGVVNIIAYNKLKHGVAKKLQSLIVVILVYMLLIRVGTMGKGFLRSSASLNL